MRFTTASAATLLSLASTSLAALSVENGKLSIIDSASSVARKTQQFTSTSPSPLGHIELNREDTIRLGFDLTDTTSGEAYQPAQVAVLAQPVLPTGVSPKIGQDWLGSVKVRKNGKAKFELDLLNAPTEFLTLGASHPISLTLFIGDFNHDPISIPLATVSIPQSIALPFPYPPDSDLPAAWEVDRYALRPEITWTFREKEKGVNSILVMFGLGLVLAPWAVLVWLAKALSLSVPAPTGFTAAFLASVISVEALIVTYWVGLKLIPTLPLFGVLLVITAWTGRRALGEVRQRRLAAEKVEGGKTE